LENPPVGSRRQFVAGTLAALSASSAAALPALAAEPRAAGTTPAAPPTRKIKLGLIGCGGRGAWITSFFVKHGGYQFHAVADYFHAVADQTGDDLGTDKARRFSGLSGYKRLIDSGVEAVVIEDVPCFYPEQARAAVEAGCHVYIAKPVAVDVPGCLAIQQAAGLATQKKLCFLVDYQLPTQTPNIEVANRIRSGALGRLAHILSFGLCGGGPDPADGPTIEHLFRGQAWNSRVALGGDNFAFYDIHILDGVTWVMGKRPVAACGRSRILRPGPHGDRSDCSGVLYEYDDGVIWNHVTNALSNNGDFSALTASFFGLQATARI
jgi:predicted dehydrogenase